MTGTAWTAHIKDFAAKRGVSYGEALKMPECKASYHEGKSKGKGLVEPFVEEKKKRGRPKTKDNIEMSIKEKTTRGRPKKYATEEEAKAAKSAKSIESNKRRAVAKKALKGGKLGAPFPEDIPIKEPVRTDAQERERLGQIQREAERQRVLRVGFSHRERIRIEKEAVKMAKEVAAEEAARKKAIEEENTPAGKRKKADKAAAKLIAAHKAEETFRLTGKGGRSSKVAIEPAPTAVANPLDIQTEMENKAALAIKRKADKADTIRAAKKASANIKEFKSLRDAYFQNPTSSHLKQAYLAMRIEKGLRDDNPVFPLEPPSASHMGGSGLALTPSGGKIYPLTMGHITQMLKNCPL